jgi:hypothetical protein
MTTIRQVRAIVSGTGSVSETVDVGLPPVFTTAPTSATVVQNGVITFVATDNLNRPITYSIVGTPPSGYSIITIP